MKSIKGKFLAMALCGVMIIAGAIGMYSYWFTNQMLHEKASMLLETRCTSETTYFNTILGDVQKSVQIMKWYCTERLQSPQSLADPVYEQAYTTRMLEMFTTIAEHTNGTAAYYLRYNPELASPTTGFFITRGTDGSFVYTPTTDLSQYAPDDAGRVGWYYEPVKAGKPVWLSPYHNLNNDMLMISYVVPLYDNDTLIGVVGMDVDFSFLHDVLDSISIYENGVAYLATDDGSTIHDHLADMDHGQCVEASATLLNGMKLVLHADYQDIVRESLPLLTRNVIILVVLVGLFILFIIHITNRITAPLKKLTAAVQQMESGDTEVKIDCSSNDEIGVLAHAFQQTASQLHSRMTNINNLAFRDSLTGVKNRLAYVNATAEIDQRITAGETEFGIVVMDANNLKHINDQFGHDAGNVYIRHIAQIICDVFAHSPVFRFGGDEFVVVLENRDLANADALLVQLPEAYAAAPFVLPEETVQVVVAQGSAVFDPQTDRCFNDVFIRADKIMYENKKRLKGVL